MSRVCWWHWLRCRGGEGCKSKEKAHGRYSSQLTLSCRYGMQWADQMFSSENGSAGSAAVDRLHWSTWYLSGQSSSAGNGTLHAGGPAVSNSTVSNTTVATPSGNSTKWVNSTQSSSDTGIDVFSSHPATNLLSGYVAGGACTDNYLCHVDNFNRISGVMQKAQSSANGSTWLGFMLVSASGGSAQTGQAGRLATFPEHVSNPHPCTGSSGCPPPPNIGPQRPPPGWTPENIPQPPTNPNAPEVQRDPIPTEDKATKERLEKQRKKEEDDREIERKCREDQQCKLDEQRK